MRVNSHYVDAHLDAEALTRKHNHSFAGTDAFASQNKSNRTF